MTLTMTDERVLLNSGASKRGWHRLERYLRCPRLFALHSAGLLGNGSNSEPLVRGSLVHVGLAHHFARLQAKQGNLAPERFYTPQEAMDLVAPTFGKLGSELLPVASETVAAYLALYSDEGWKILHVEQEFTTEISDGTRTRTYTLRPDLGVEDSSGRVWIIDHKCQAHIGHIERYTLSGQFLGLQLLGRQLYGAAFGGCIVNAIQAWPKFKVKKYPVDSAPESLKRFPQLVLDVEDQIARLENEGRDPMDWPGACSEFMCTNVYDRCEAFEICRFGLEE